MRTNGITEAVVLAAGNGRRMAARSSLPKPLIPVAGEAVLNRVLKPLSDLGIRKVFVVVGYRGDEIQNDLMTNSAPLGIEWVENPHFHLANGISLLAVEDKLKGPFLLLMSDHLLEWSILGDLFDSERAPQMGGILATDSKINRVFDLPDATKVESRSDRVQKIGKHLADFNAVDTGVFLLSQSVFPAMRESSSRGDQSLTGGISVLAKRQSVRTWDIGDRRWIDIDTPEALAEAERLVNAGYFGNGGPSPVPLPTQPA